MARSKKLVDVNAQPVVVPAEPVVVEVEATQPVVVASNGLPKLPKMPRVRKAKPAKSCECGCGQMTKGGRFVPGHDGRLHGWALRVERKVCTLAEVEPAATREAVRKLLGSKAE